MEHPTLDFDSSRDPTVCGFEPRIWLCADNAEPAWDSVSLCLSVSVSLSLSAPPPLALSLSLSLSLKISKYNFKNLNKSHSI